MSVFSSTDGDNTVSARCRALPTCPDVVELIPCPERAVYSKRTFLPSGVVIPMRLLYEKRLDPSVRNAPPLFCASIPFTHWLGTSLVVTVLILGIFASCSYYTNECCRLFKKCLLFIVGVGSQVARCAIATVNKLSRCSTVPTLQLPNYTTVDEALKSIKVLSLGNFGCIFNQSDRFKGRHIIAPTVHWCNRDDPSFQVANH